jgi:hypothetical protein
MAHAEQTENIIAKAVPRVLVCRKRNPICLLPTEIGGEKTEFSAFSARIVGAAGDGQAGLARLLQPVNGLMEAESFIAALKTLRHQNRVFQ